MLNFLAGFDAPLSLRDTDGHSPLYYAKQQGSGVMAKALKELLGEAAAKEVSTSIMHFFTKPKYISRVVLLRRL